MWLKALALDQKEMRLKADKFPEQIPFSIEESLDPNFWPD